MTPFNRRRFMQALGAVAGAGVISRFGGQAFADVMRQSSRRFIFCYFGGGWDQLLFLDPRDPTRFNSSNVAQTQTHVAYEQLGAEFPHAPVTAGNLTFGPVVAPLDARYANVPKLTDFASKIAIVRGLNMGTLGHEVGYRYFLTARFPQGITARGTSIATELTGQMAVDLPMSNLALQMESYNEKHPASAGAITVNSSDDLLAVLDRAASLVESDDVEAALEAYENRAPDCGLNLYDRTGLVSRMRYASNASRTLFTNKVVDKFRFATSDDAASQAIRTQYGFGRGDALSPGARAALAAQAIKLKMSQCVSVNMGLGLDTHGGNNLAHARSLLPGVNALAALIDDLSKSDAPPELQALGGSKWLDHTTILAFSEFARTPLFNQTNGRDHHLCSSCMLIGAGIQGNQVIGASSDIAMGVGRYDVTARQVVQSGGENLKPEHIAATLLASAGLVYSDTGLRESPLWALIPNS